MDDTIRKLQTKRFVIEDSYTKVTADGEPHEMMTLIAGLSGVVAAIIILVVLISLIVCKKDTSTQNCKNCASGIDSAQCAQKQAKERRNQLSNGAQKVSISTIDIATPSIMKTPKINSNGEGTTDFVITSGNFGSNLNSAFVDSEFNLADSLSKGKKKMRWHDELTVHDPAKETVIDMTVR